MTLCDFCLRPLAGACADPLCRIAHDWGAGNRRHAKRPKAQDDALPFVCDDDHADGGWTFAPDAPAPDGHALWFIGADHSKDYGPVGFWVAVQGDTPAALHPGSLFWHSRDGYDWGHVSLRRLRGKALLWSDKAGWFPVPIPSALLPHGSDPLAFDGFAPDDLPC